MGAWVLQQVSLDGAGNSSSLRLLLELETIHSSLALWLLRGLSLEVMRKRAAHLHKQALVLLQLAGVMLVSGRRPNCHAFFEKGVASVVVQLCPGGGKRGVDVVILRLNARWQYLFLLKLQLLVNGLCVDRILGNLKQLLLVILDIVELLPQQRLYLLLVLTFQQGTLALKLLRLEVLQLLRDFFNSRTVDHHPQQLINRVDVLASFLAPVLVRREVWYKMVDKRFGLATAVADGFNGLGILGVEFRVEDILCDDYANVVEHSVQHMDVVGYSVEVALHEVEGEMSDRLRNYLQVLYALFG